MLVEFSFGNFRSFKDIHTLNLNAASIKSKYESVDINNTFKFKKHTLLKSKAIYGANASGKSNIVNAFLSFIATIHNSVKDEEILSKTISPFELSTETEKEPSFFQMIFILNNVVYRYGFEATRSEITSEWLYGTPGEREVYFFIREKLMIKTNPKQYKEGEQLKNFLGKENQIIRPNSLFLTAVTALNGKLSMSLVNYFANIGVISGLADNVLNQIAENAMNKKEKREEMAELLKRADVGIENLGILELTKDNLPKGAPAKLIEDLKSGKKHRFVVTQHSKFDKDGKRTRNPAIFNMTSHESEGTKKMFQISSIILDILKNGRILVFDEFDARFHPLLTQKIVEMFNSNRTNPRNAQLVFVTHDTNLLSAKLLRRDQIAFVEKDKYGGSHLYTLVNFKGVRNDSSFEKDYIQGKYGAIPFLGNFEEIFG